MKGVNVFYVVFKDVMIILTTQIHDRQKGNQAKDTCRGRRIQETQTWIKKHRGDMLRTFYHYSNRLLPA